MVAGALSPDPERGWRWSSDRLVAHPQGNLMAVGSVSVPRWGERGEQPWEALGGRGLHPFQSWMEAEDRQLRESHAWHRTVYFGEEQRTPGGQRLNPL